MQHTSLLMDEAEDGYRMIPIPLSCRQELRNAPGVQNSDAEQVVECTSKSNSTVMQWCGLESAGINPDGKSVAIPGYIIHLHHVSWWTGLSAQRVAFCALCIRADD
jgi:hypothetical protein